MKPAPGELWRRKRDGRQARIVGVHFDDRLVLYRYLSAVPSRGLSGMVRTNTTPMNMTRFVVAFEKVS